MGRWPRMRPWHLDRDRVGAGRAAPGGLSAVEGGDSRWEELGRLVFGIERLLKMRLLAWNSVMTMLDWLIEIGLNNRVSCTN